MNRKIVVFLLVAFLAACVTINIYFPAAAAQEVADQIIDDVWQLKEGKEGEAAKSDEAVKTEPKDTELKDASEATAK